MLRPDELTFHWLSTYGLATPFDLRHTLHDRWVRFHSLPESKRYAETDDERLIVLRRYNSIIDSLAENGESLLLLTTGYSDTSTPVRDDSDLQLFDPSANPWWSIAPTDEDDSTHRHIFVSEWRWERQIFDSLLMLVADDTVADVCIVSVGGNWIFHPYDGGSDVILKTVSERNRLHDRFSEWLSEHPDGL
jgi:hypothetical protein